MSTNLKVIDAVPGDYWDNGADGYVYLISITHDKAKSEATITWVGRGKHSLVWESAYTDKFGFGTTLIMGGELVKESDLIGPPYRPHATPKEERLPKLYWKDGHLCVATRLAGEALGYESFDYYKKA